MSDLENLGEAFLDRHRALGFGPAPVKHDSNSLKLLRRCSAEEGIAVTDVSLTTADMNLFAGWLRAPPAQTWLGSMQRSAYGIHSAPKDIKAVVR
jgi:hypothetical protein